MKIHNYTIAFDTNIFKRIIKKNNEKCFDTLFSDLNKLVNPKNEFSGFMSTITPFLILEYLGVVPPDISIDKFTKQEIEDAKGNIQQSVFLKAYDRYRSESSLSEENLLGKNEENKIYVSRKGIKIYEEVVGRVVSSKGFSERIHFSLAADFSYRYPYQKFLSEDDVTRIRINDMYDIYRAQKMKQNFTQMRAILKLNEDMKRKKGAKGLDDTAKEILSAIEGVKGYRDLFDLDLVQIACLGAFIDNKKYPVIFLTEDSKVSVIQRIRLFKNTFQFFNNQAVKLKKIEDNLEQMEYVQILEGKIAFVKKDSCNILEIIDVKSIVPEVDVN